MSSNLCKSPATAFFFFESESNKFCDVAVVSKAITLKCVVGSGFHLFLITAERYVAIKHTFTHENLVTEVRIIVASGVAWVVAIMFPMEVWISSSQLVTLLTSFVILFIFLPVMIYCNISVYMEVRRNQRQIATNQVTLEAKNHFLKNKKAFCTTVTILVAVFLCCAPVRLCLVIFATVFNGKIPNDVGYSVLHLLTILPLSNSLFNPLIYAVKIICFRVAFIQLLSRKTTAQAEEFERKIFGTRQIGVIATAEQQQKTTGRENDENEGCEALNLNSGHETTVRPRQE